MLHGAVEHAKGEERAVRLEVDQHGTESENSGVWSTCWTEVHRRVMMSPFYLRLASGARVRVEPTEEVFLVDDMDGVIHVDITKRTRVAELVPGELTFAVGELAEGFDPEAGGGYRQSPHGLVLRPPRRRPIHLSSKPLGERFSARARFDGFGAASVLFAAVLVQLIWFGFHQRLWFGQTVEATIVKLAHRTSRDQGETVHHHEVTAAIPGVKGVLTDEVDRDDYMRLRSGMKVLWTHVPGQGDHSAIGPEATVPVITVLVPLPVSIFALAFIQTRRSLRPWYEQRMLVESERGRLEKKKP